MLGIMLLFHLICSSLMKENSSNMDRRNSKEKTFSGSFWEGISPIIFCSQIFGILPLKGVRTKPTGAVHFSWVSIGTFMCFIFMVWDLVVIGSHIYYDRNFRINAGIITTLLFHSMGFCIYGAFLQLARRWVSIITGWTQMEQRFLQPPYLSSTSKQLKHRLVIIGVFITVLSIGEHALFQGSRLYMFFVKGTECNITNRGLATYFIERFPYVYELMPSGASLFLSQLVSIFGTAAWNFLDLFIILISIGISTRFEQLTSALHDHLTQGKCDSKSMLKFRMDFIAICDLLAYVDNNMGIVVFLSAINNLYFVCSQLLNVFNPLRFLVDYIYYWYSLIYLVGRTLYLFVAAANVNEAAESPKTLLHDIPAEDWNEESSRFLFQINSKTIALSAMGFCNFTSRLILTMAGAIVTFELVMMQFNSTTGGLSPLCE